MIKYNKALKSKLIDWFNVKKNNHYKVFLFFRELYFTLIESIGLSLEFLLVYNIFIFSRKNKLTLFFSIVTLLIYFFCLPFRLATYLILKKNLIYELKYFYLYPKLRELEFKYNLFNSLTYREEILQNWDFCETNDSLRLGKLIELNFIESSYMTVADAVIEIYKDKEYKDKKSCYQIIFHAINDKKIYLMQDREMFNRGFNISKEYIGNKISMLSTHQILHCDYFYNILFFISPLYWLIKNKNIYSKKIIESLLDETLISIEQIKKHFEILEEEKNQVNVIYLPDFYYLCLNEVLTSKKNELEEIGIYIISQKYFNITFEKIIYNLTQNDNL